MNCSYCGKKCSLEKDFCIPQDSVYICKSCYEWQSRISNLKQQLAEKEKLFAENLIINSKETAVIELEKVLDFMRQKDSMGFSPSFKRIKEQIREQIK